jgi:hypothetical protein
MGIPTEDLAKEMGGEHGAVERVHTGHMATGASPLGKGVPRLEHTRAGHLGRERGARGHGHQCRPTGVARAHTRAAGGGSVDVGRGWRRRAERHAMWSSRSPVETLATVWNGGACVGHEGGPRVGGRLGEVGHDG